MMFLLKASKGWHKWYKSENRKVNKERIFLHVISAGIKGY